MGNCTPKFFGWEKLATVPLHKIHIGIFGLPGSGKTTILKQLEPHQELSLAADIKLSEYFVPHSDLNIIKMTKQKLHNFNMAYNVKLDAIIYTVDASDMVNLSQLKADFQKVAQNPRFERTFFLILANKQDLEGTLNASDFVDILSLATVKQRWVVQECVATTGKGLANGIFKLVEMLIHGSFQESENILCIDSSTDEETVSLDEFN